MSYQVLARKWRPKSFRELVGQEHVLQALVNALDHDRLHHAYLFTGTRGVGKTTIARILAKCLNCEQGVSSEPCGECSSCLEIAEGRSVDLLEVDAASRTKVEDTRELLENVQYAPSHSRYKVYLIDEVHMLSTHSFNALLKTLEEPPPHVKFLLATTDPQKLPATVLSRCLQFNLKNMPPEQIVGHLGKVLEQEMVGFEEPALWLLGRAAAGSMRDALSLTDQAISFGSGKVGEADVRSMLGSVDLSFIYQLLEALCEGEPTKLLDVVAHMGEHAPDFEGGLDELLSLIHRVTMAQVVPEAIDNSWGDAQRIRQIAGTITAEDAQLFYQIALNGKRDIGLAPDPRSGFEMILLRMLAFRPEAVIDNSLGAGELQAVEQQEQQSAAVEVGTQVKKPHEEPQAAARSRTAPEPEPVAVSVATPLELSPVCHVGAFALTDLNPDNWPQLLESLGLVGIVYNIASHCDLRSSDDHGLQFVLDSGNASLFNDSHNDKIRLALENYFGLPLSVRIVPGDVQRETPAMRKARLAQERQQEAIASIEGDPQLQKLIARFDGELDLSSIVPTDL
ncbi:MAG: DNA polymerase III subunit gamma/tau [Gammaproteobacteria bacterium]|nr:MAG: DNA polymerase III subunit gamma/tau [Gammaproteobacteria bacterium]RLA62347.1 MAG: DNA polymerase III subunit gamma/tau [Gammaproteobacteria bacterium]